MQIFGVVWYIENPKNLENKKNIEKFKNQRIPEEYKKFNELLNFKESNKNNRFQKF